MSAKHKMRTGSPDPRTLLFLSFIFCLQVSALEHQQHHIISLDRLTRNFPGTAGLYPSIVNLASHATISSNATCGLNGPAKYCKLVEHVDRRWIQRGSQCSICDANSSLKSERHSIENAIDGRGNRWWQSPTVEQGYLFRWVTITLDLRQVFQIAYVIVKAANSPRPGNWILEKSIDGNNWQPWQFFAVSNSECFKVYGLPASPQGAPRYRYDTQVTCTSYFSQLIPLQNGEIHVSLINGRPSAEDPSPELIAFTSARFIRLRFQKIRTLHGDLMTLGYSPPTFADPFVTRRYFYSIKDISIGGMCICYGHARECPVNSNSREFFCKCEHYTTGRNCETCLPGYNQLKWQPGNNGFKCEACNCHGHAEECYYDAGIDERGESRNIRGRYIGGGVCIQCRDNTEGVNCERCVDGFYRPINVDPAAKSPCLPCHCNPHGGTRVRNDGSSFLCVKDESQMKVDENFLPGHCICKVGYSGPKCDRCETGYWGFPRCEPCPCNVSGSVENNACDGKCICKRHVIGADCSKCEIGYYNLQKENPMGCEKCFCFGDTSFCQSSSLLWSTLHTNLGWEVREIKGRRKSPALTDPKSAEPYVDNSQVVRELESTIYYWSTPRSYLGKRLLSYGGYLRYTVSYELMNGQRPRLLQEADVILVGNEKTLLFNRFGIILEPGIEKKVSIKLAPSYDDTDSRGWIVADTLFPASKMDMMSVLLDVKKILIRAVYCRNNEAIYRIRDVYLDVAVDGGSGKLASSIEVCRCPPGYSGFSCEKCVQGYWRSKNLCLPCQCHGHSNNCNSLNGACENCDHNTMGVHCEQCKPGFFGDATWGTSNDCQSCACPLPISTNNFSPTCHLDRSNGDMICLQCPEGYEGQRCEKCQHGYYGNPVTPGSLCRACRCNGNAETCNRDTGKCISCRNHTAGNHCERCEAAYYGDAVIEKNCKTCNCHPIGSLNRHCDSTTGQCSCMQGVHGRRCDMCSNNHYLSSKAGRCVSCNCNAIGSETAQCLPDGTCRCREGVTGRLCNSCNKGFYRFSSRGCTACDCEKTNGNCDPNTGQCLCPPNTRGYKCLKCIPGFYQWNRIDGCKDCQCDIVGAINRKACHSVTGICQCKKKFGGKRCNKCKKGFYGFPKCKPCRCNLKGTELATCSGPNLKKCSCSDRGQCHCKANVLGRRCNQCAANTFSLTSSHPEGCSSCYCSGVTTSCAQAQYVWGNPISLKSALVDLFNKNGSDVLLTHNLISVNNNAAFRISFKRETYYWKLPEKFNGNQSLSYGGNLQYTIRYVAEMPAFSEATQDGNVVIKGGDDVQKTIQYQNNYPISGKAESYVVPMREFGWTNLDSGQNVTRYEFIDVLTNIQFFLIKASYGYLLDQSRLSNVVLDTAIPFESGRGDEASYRPLAIGIERCFCPTGYTGLSCQSCAPGYTRVQKYPNGHGCEPCNCNNRSQTCMAETGHCLNCIGDFTGRHCEKCKGGYFLVENTCQKCGCPGIRVNNNFSPTCHLDRTSSEANYVCDSCRTGYEGKHCEQCADGYFGDPMRQGGFCAKCGCNVAGAIDGVCNKTTGQCHCDEGIRGRICDQCHPGHVITSQGCRECLDPCITILVLEIEALRNKTNRINLNDMAPLPWDRINSLQDTTDQLQVNLSKFSKKINGSRRIFYQVVDKEVMNLEFRFLPLVNQSSTCSAKTRKFVGLTKKIHKKARKLRKKSQRLNRFAKSAQKNVGKLLNQLQNSSNPNTDLMRSIIEVWMIDLRNRGLSSYFRVAKKDIRSTNKLVHELGKNFTKKARKREKNFRKKQEKLFRRLNKLFRKLFYTIAIQKNITHSLNSTKAKNKMNQQMLRQNRGEIDKIQNEMSITTRYIANSRDLLKTAGDYHGSATEFLNELLFIDYPLKTSLLNVTKHLKHLLDTSLDPAPENTMKKVTKQVPYYTKKLENLTNYIVGVHENVSLMSLNQTEAVFRWTNIAKTFEITNKTASTAVVLGFQSRSSARKNLQKKSEASFRRAHALFNRVKNQKELILGYKGDLQRLNVNLKSVNYSAQRMDKQYISLLVQLSRIKQGFLSGKPPITPAHVYAAIQKSIPIISQIKKQFLLVKKVSQQLDVALRNVQNHQTSVDRISNNVAGIPNILIAFKEEANITARNSAKVKSLNKGLRKNIRDIRKLIEDAQRKAASIRQVSVRSDGKCAMLYKPDLSASRRTEITLNVQARKPNNMLFYLGREKHDYIAVETRDYKVTVTWDLGGGIGFVKNSLPLTSNGRKSWSRIKIVRLNQNLEVTVYRNSNKTEVKRTVGGRSPGNFEVLDVNENDVMFVGGLFNNTKLPYSIAYRTFTGCMGEAFLQGKSIGLWNYLEINNKRLCKKCMESEPLGGDKSSEIYSFTGRSFSVLSLPMNYDKKRTKISFKFQTFSSKGMIFFMGSKKLNDFLFLEISDGKLVLKVNLGSGIYSNKTRMRYNTGKWNYVSLNRNLNNISLGVKKSGKLQEIIHLNLQLKLAILDLDSDDIFTIGGFPPNKFFGYPVKPISFVGCLREFVFMKKKLKLKSNKVGDVIQDAGVSYDCPSKIFQASVAKNGFIEIPPVDLSESGTISMAFKTREPNALLLFASSSIRNRKREQKQNISYYSLSLTDGKIYASVSTGQDRPLEISLQQISYNDGYSHFVTLKRNNGSIILQTNENRNQTEIMPLQSSNDIAVRRVFVGGVPKKYKISSFVRVDTSLNGCVNELNLNGSVNFKEAVKAKNAFFGTCHFVNFHPSPPESFTAPSPPPVTQNPIKTEKMDESDQKDQVYSQPSNDSHCRKPEKIVFKQNSANFGSNPHSHLVYKLKQNLSKSFSFEMKVRTRGKSGLLLYAGPRTEKDFFALKLKDGKPVFQFDNGIGIAEVFHSKSINDGQWHKIRIRKNKRRGWLSIDSKRRVHVTSKKGVKHMNVRNLLYVGGLPINYIKSNVGQISNSMDVCVRDLKLNKNVRLSLTNVHSSYEVQPCFNYSESGAYFNGNGYIKQYNTYRVGPDMLIEMDFRTWKSNAVLLSINSRRLDGLSLELVNGTIFFRANNGDGAFGIEYSDVFTTNQSNIRYGLCNGKWHHLRAEKEGTTLRLTVDGTAVDDVNSRTSTSSADTKDPLFIGGIPDYPAQLQLLQTKEKFEGCIRNLQIKRRNVDFEAAEFRQGVFSNSCPKYEAKITKNKKSKVT